ncbi:hypothetical protein Catovirus_1_81 [Catovirus CTV1]|uniref:Uncharacterized protein n=1 Tax=Catovirus CTV1 TaxID=1977631 RepID=A0A1V0S8K3_9VIRU|nr:hypothetical protein Catovirus_1_81 [Catovirus CTV1]
MDEDAYPDKKLIQLYDELKTKKGPFTNRAEFTDVAQAMIDRDMISEANIPIVEKKIKECRQANAPKAKKQKITRSQSTIVEVPKGAKRIVITFE